MFTLQNDRYTRFITRFIAMYLVVAFIGLSAYRVSYKPMSRMEIAESILMSSDAASFKEMPPEKAAAEIEKRTKQQEESQHSEWNTLKAFSCELPLVSDPVILTSKGTFVHTCPAGIVKQGYRTTPVQPPAC